jgi:hypothetical protein
MEDIVKYYIYHIPGIKIGCTKRLEIRMKQQGFFNWEVLEIHSDKYKASKREIELQKQYGYSVDNREYHILCKLAVKGGFKQGPENVKSGQLKSISKKGGIAGNRARGLKYGKIAAESGQLAKARKKAIQSTSKCILQYDLNGNIIKEWNSISECERGCNISRYHIRNVLNNKTKNYNGFVFKLNKDEA